jgi:hypothetical protein
MEGSSSPEDEHEPRLLGVPKLNVDQVQSANNINNNDLHAHPMISARSNSRMTAGRASTVGSKVVVQPVMVSAVAKKKYDSSSSSDEDDSSPSSPSYNTSSSGNVDSTPTEQLSQIEEIDDEHPITSRLLRWKGLMMHQIFNMFTKPRNKKECLEHSSCYILHPDHKLRIFVYNIVHQKWFEGFIIIVILTNCIVLAMDDPTTNVEPTFQQNLNTFFLVSFTTEMCLKFIAFGVALHEGSYFRSGWNVLDFVIVMLSFLQLVPGFGNFTAFRTMRVLRPLRSMNAIPQLKTIATCLVHSVKGLANVFLLAMFFYCVFAIFAVQLWMGNMQFRCQYDYDGTIDPEMFCTQTSGGSVVGFTCPQDLSCVPYGNPNNGYTSFDNVLWALLVVFQTITLEGWSTLMFIAMDSCGWPAAIFFVLVVIIGSYFVLNLCLAVISFHFTIVKERMMQKELEQVKAEEVEMRQSEEGLQRARVSLRLQSGANLDAFLSQAETTTHMTGSDVHRVLDIRELESMTLADRFHLARQLPQTSAGSLLSVAERDKIYPGDEEELSPLQPGHRAWGELKKLRPDFGTYDFYVVLLYRVRLRVFEAVEGKAFDNHMENTRKIEVHKLEVLGRQEEAAALRESIPDSNVTYFGKFVYGAIIANTAVLAVSRFDESEMQTQVSTILNIIFSVLFMLEMALKLFCMGPVWYVRDSFNIFDGGVTILSLVEIVFLSGSSTFSVFRAFRMLRVLRLLQGIPSLRQLIEVFGLALNECGYLFVILALYFLMSSLVGMQFFADSLQTNGIAGDEVISSFESFLKAFYTMVQVMTYDSWPDIMWNAMNATSLAAVVFFVLSIFIGNLCVLNLLVAILIDSFDEYAKKHAKKKGLTVRHGSESDSEDEEGGPMQVRRGLAITILSAEPAAPATTLLPRGANDFFTHEIPGIPQLDLLKDEQRHLHIDVIHQPGVVLGVQNDPVDDHELLSVDKVSSYDAEPVQVCASCGDPIVQPFPPISSSISPISPQELHDRLCERIQFRKIKERVIDTLLRSMISLESESDDEENNSSPGPSSMMSFGKAPPPPPVTSDGDANHNVSFSMNPFAAPQAESGEFESPFQNLQVNRKDRHGKRIAGGNGRFPTPANIEDVFGRAWEVGLLLGDNVEDYIYAQTWKPVRKLLKSELQLLKMRIGEEQVGRALTAYTRANVPHQILTNGGHALFVFGPRNWLRVQLTALILWPPFDYFILLVILGSSIIMAIDNPNNDEQLSDQITLAGRVFTGIFCAEMVIKGTALGFAFHEGAYLRDPWNWLDFLVVLVSVASWILEVYSTSKVSALKVLRTLRVMRPLRLINRNRGLRMVVLTLLQSVKGIANITLILVVVFLIFAILGVQLFGGILYQCNDSAISTRVDCIGSYTVNFTVVGTVEANRTMDNGTWYLQNMTALLNVSQLTSREWVNANFNFDNTIQAFISLFHIATLDDWGNMMYACIDGVDYDHGPSPWYNIWYGFYFVAFILVGAMFLMNMFIGLIIENFQSTKAHMDGVGLLTDDQRLWVETQRMMLNFRPERLKVAGRFKFQQALAHLVEETFFELGSAAVVMANVITIALSYYNQPEDFTLALANLNIAFTSLFIAEASVKIAAYDVRYFADGWNRFDFFIVCLGIMDMSDSSFLPINVGIIRVFRVFRIARILALVRKARDIRVLLETLWYSIPSLANIGAFMFLVLFIFTVLGVQIWGQVLQDGEGLTRHANFEGFGTAFLFLIQVTTLDNWGVTMTSLTITQNCGPETNAEGVDHCGSEMAPLYFIPFILLSSYVMVNLFCAIILDNFSTSMELEKSQLKVADLKKFADAWAVFDPDATMLTKTRNFPNLLSALKPPLGIERKQDRRSLLKVCREYVIPEHEGEIHFVETLIPLARKVLGVSFTDEEIRDHEELWKLQFPDLNQLRVVRHRQKRVTIDQYFAATHIAGAFRRRLARKVVGRMRLEKREDLEIWYEDNGVPEDEWDAIERMDAEEKERASRIFADRKLIDDLVQRGRSDSITGEEEDEDVEGLDRTAAVAGLLASLAPNDMHQRGAGAGVVSCAPLTRKSSLARRESMKLGKRRQSLGLTGFSQLWAQHAADL